MSNVFNDNAIKVSGGWGRAWKATIKWCAPFGLRPAQVQQHGGASSTRSLGGHASGNVQGCSRNNKSACGVARLAVVVSGYPCGAKFESELYIAGTGRRPVRRTRAAQMQVEPVTDVKRTTTPQVVSCSSLWVCLCTHVVPTQTEVLVNERAFTAQGYLGQRQGDGDEFPINSINPRTPRHANTPTVEFQVNNFPMSTQLGK